MNLFNTGIRPLIDAHLEKKGEEVRDYGMYWSASSAGYCQRKLIFERLKVPPVKPREARLTRVFEVGHIFHEWIQRLTREAGLSIAQEMEFKDENLLVIGHIDDLVLTRDLQAEAESEPLPKKKLVLYDYKTQNSMAFHRQKGGTMSHYHRMQLGTYMYMIRNSEYGKQLRENHGTELLEARILKISKDDLSMTEEVLVWTPDLEKEVSDFWHSLNQHLIDRTMPPCTCADHENGFMARPKFNPYYFNGEPCSLDWLKQYRDSKN